LRSPPPRPSGRSISSGILANSHTLLRQTSYDTHSAILSVFVPVPSVFVAPPCTFAVFVEVPERPPLVERLVQRLSAWRSLYRKLFAERPEQTGQRCTPALRPVFPPLVGDIENSPVVVRKPADHIPVAGDNKPAAVAKHRPVAELAAKQRSAFVASKIFLSEPAVARHTGLDSDTTDRTPPD